MKTHEEIKNFIETLLAKAGVEFEGVSTEETGGQTVFQVKTPSGNALIGNRGETLRALNHIVKKAAAPPQAADAEDERAQFIVDVNQYHAHKIVNIMQTAKLLAERARSLKYNVEMTPMSSYERMIVHSVLADEPGITTESYGEGRDRRVVIKYSE